MYVGNATTLNAVGIGDLIREGTSWGLRTAPLEDRLGNLIERLTDALDTAAEANPRTPSSLVEHIRSRVAAMADGTAEV